MKAIFIGDPAGDKSEGITFRGIYFPRNEVVEVEDEATCKKLQGNSHFKCEPVKDAPDVAMDEYMDKDALIEEAKALGIKATKNWGVAKLQEAIAQAKGE